MAVPLLSQWIKKEVTFGGQKLLLFWLGRSDPKTRMTEAEDFGKVSKRSIFSIF
jgi:hypothetical protein